LAKVAYFQEQVSQQRRMLVNLHAQGSQIINEI